MRNERRNYLLVGVFVLAMAGALTLWVTLVSTRTGPSEPYHVVYRNVAGLRSGVEILFEGYPVGLIDAIEPIDRDGRRLYRVDVQVARGWPIPEDSVATIASDFFAAAVIDIRGGESATLLEPGSEIPSREAADILSAVNDVAGEVLTLIERDVQPTLRTLAEGAPGIVENLDAFTEELEAAARQLNALLEPTNVERVGSILANVETATRDANRLMAELGGTRERVDGLLSRVETMVADEDGQLSRSVADLEHSLAAVAGHIDAITDNLEQTTRNLSEFSQQLRENPGVLLRGRESDEGG